MEPCGYMAKDLKSDTGNCNYVKRLIFFFNLFRWFKHLMNNKV